MASGWGQRPDDDKEQETHQAAAEGQPEQLGAAGDFGFGRPAGWRPRSRCGRPRPGQDCGESGHRRMRARDGWRGRASSSVAGRRQDPLATSSGRVPRVPSMSASMKAGGNVAQQLLCRSWNGVESPLRGDRPGT